MSGSDVPREPLRQRREPPEFRRVEVRRAEVVNPCLVRITLAGPELAGFRVEEPAASIRLLFPPPGARELVMPSWNGNEFLLPDGRRPAIRTFTPLRAVPDARTLDIEAVIHGDGVASQWAEAVEAGAQAAISGPGRGYVIDRDAPEFFLGGDESAVPAIGQLLGLLPVEIPTQVHLDARPAARVELPAHARTTVAWHDSTPGAPPGAALVAAVRAADIAPGTRIWAAGEAASVQRIRRHLFEERGVTRADATIRGYWKHGRAGGESEK